MNPRQAAQLTRISQMAFRSDRARMAELERAESRLLSQLDDIRRQERQARDRMSLAPDAMAVSGQDRLWERWIELRRTAIQTELARLMARKADLTAVLRASFGRKAASEALEEQAIRTERQDVERKSAWLE